MSSSKLQVKSSLTETDEQDDNCNQQRDQPSIEAPSYTGSRSFSWSPNYETRKAALFRFYSTFAVLQHVRTTTVQQRGPSVCKIDENPHLQDVDGGVLSELRGEGFDVIPDTDGTTTVSGGKDL